MKRTLIDKNQHTFPPLFKDLINSANVYDSSSSKDARVYFIDTGSGYYLKRSGHGALAKEAEMAQYFNTLGLSAPVLAYEPLGDGDWLLTERIHGEDCTHEDYLSDPKRLAVRLGEELRALHSVSFSNCPVQNRMESYFSLAESNYNSGNYDTSHFPDSFGYRSAEEAYAVFSEGKSALICDTLLHGDYCLPNILLDGWRFSAFIDVGMGGVGERHIDLFWGAWTLLFNLKTDRYRDRFFDAYGRDKVDTDIIRVIAAAEVFG